MYRLRSRLPRLSRIWSIFGMPRVVTLSTWVSPRWNRPEPCAVGSTPTTAVDAGALADDALPDDLLQQRLGGVVDLAHPLGELGLELLDDGLGGLALGLLA